MFDPGLWLAGLVPILLLAFGTWGLSLVRRDVSIVDAVWPLFFLSASAAYALGHAEETPRTRLVLVLVTLWAVRLSLHIAARAWGEPEDRRYRAIRARHEPGFAWKSLYLVFALQGGLAWLISLPLLAALTGSAPVSGLDFAGVALWVVGFAVESHADWRLMRFRRDPANRNRVLDAGLWRYSRHPNYFGECLLWWGYYLIALAAGGWWSVVAPVLMTFLLLRVSGIPLLEKDMAERRPAYRDYAQRTNAFIPGPPRAVAPLAQRAQQGDGDG